MTAVECPLCATARPPTDGHMVWVRCIACGALVFREVQGPAVLVAHESDPIAQMIGVTLMDAGFAPVRVERGEQALELLRRRRPPALVLDVALTDGMSFQVIDAIRSSADLRSTKVVLVASVFSRTAYKRRPATLHGADAYVEQHHITDVLPERLAELLGEPAPATQRLQAGARQRIIDGDTRTDLAGSARVQALARSIVADIALYHENEIRGVTVGEESRAVAAALAEGRALLREMTNPSELDSGDPIAAAFADVVRNLRGTHER